MLKAATATIRLSSSPIIFFSIFTAWKSSPLRSRQSCHFVPSGSACWLSGSARDVVHHLKYEGWTGVARAMARAMKSLDPLVKGVTLVPIPLGAKRLRSRGYNQAERLARDLGAVRDLPVRTVLRRRRDTPSQTSLTPEQRASNVAGAFVAPAPLSGTFVLVDDVCTTGATLAEAAAALRLAGAAQVDAVTFARAPLPVELMV